MNHDVLKITRKIDELVSIAEQEYKSSRHALAYEKLQALRLAQDVCRNVFFESIDPERLPPLPRLKMDDLPDVGSTEPAVDFHARMVEKYGNTWRLEFHDQAGLHWNLNDEEPPNTFGFRTVLTCTDDEFDEVDEKATAVWDELMKAHGKVEYLDFYKAMNA